MTIADPTPNKVCPVVLRVDPEGAKVLAFRHPHAGCQLVKGTIKAGESADSAAIRELREESGIDGISIREHLGIWDPSFESQIWTFFRCDAPDLKNEWIYHTEDGGGLEFQFFWHPIAKNPGAEWHWVYRRAVEWLRDKVA